MSKHALARIVPPPLEGDGPHRTQGTQVMVGDQKLDGVTRVELIAEVNALWRAVIHCHVHPTDLMAAATIHEPTAWQRVRRWLRGS